MTNIILIDLGWCVGKLDTKQMCLTIMSPSAPAEAVRVWGESQLRALRDALGDALDGHKAN